MARQPGLPLGIGPWLVEQPALDRGSCARRAGAVEAVPLLRELRHASGGLRSGCMELSCLHLVPYRASRLASDRDRLAGPRFRERPTSPPMGLVGPVREPLLVGGGGDLWCGY